MRYDCPIKTVLPTPTGEQQRQRTKEEGAYDRKDDITSDLKTYSRERVLEPRGKTRCHQKADDRRQSGCLLNADIWHE